jgi:hypothetical protein
MSYTLVHTGKTAVAETQGLLFTHKVFIWASFQVPDHQTTFHHLGLVSQALCTYAIYMILMIILPCSVISLLTVLRLCCSI